MSNGHTEKYRALLMARESELGHSQLPRHSSQNGGYQKDIRYQVVTRKWKERDPLPPHCWGGAYTSTVIMENSMNENRALYKLKPELP